MGLRRFGTIPRGLSGSGSGYGYGYGYGSGSGSGYGDGYGYGYGSGYGDGYGDGSGYGYAAFVVAMLSGMKLKPPPKSTLALWRSDASGRSANGGRMKESAHEGMEQEVQGPLELCGSRALHGTHHPMRWEGERLWVVALHHPVKKDETKMGSLKRTILKEIPNFCK